MSPIYPYALPRIVRAPTDAAPTIASQLGALRMPTPVPKVLGIGRTGCLAAERFATTASTSLPVALADLELNRRYALPTLPWADLPRVPGASSDPGIRMSHTKLADEALRHVIHDANVLILLAYLGGTVGANYCIGAVRLAKRLQMKTVALVTMPHETESECVRIRAKRGLRLVATHSDVTIPIMRKGTAQPIHPQLNDGELLAQQGALLLLQRLLEPNAPYESALAMDDSQLERVHHEVGLSVGVASGYERAKNAANQALTSSSLARCGADEIRTVCVHVAGNPSSLSELDVHRAVETVVRHLPEPVTVLQAASCAADLGTALQVTLWVEHTGRHINVPPDTPFPNSGALAQAARAA